MTRSYQFYIDFNVANQNQATVNFSILIIISRQLHMKIIKFMLHYHASLIHMQMY